MKAAAERLCSRETERSPPHVYLRVLQAPYFSNTAEDYLVQCGPEADNPDSSCRQLTSLRHAPHEDFTAFLPFHHPHSKTRWCLYPWPSGRRQTHFRHPQATATATPYPSQGPTVGRIPALTSAPVLSDGGRPPAEGLGRKLRVLWSQPLLLQRSSL